MKPRVLIWPWFFNNPIMRNYAGIVIGRFIVMKHESESLLAHEMVHQRQMDRYTVPGFYLVYLYHYVCGLFKYGSHRSAYRMNPLERQAYGDNWF